MIKILVIGGCGFIGSNLCKELLKFPNYDVFSLDNYSSGSKENEINGVTYFNGDSKNISEIINFSPKIVFHLGEFSRVELSYRKKKLVWESNILGTYEVVRFCIKNNSKLIYAGSSTKFSDKPKSLSPYTWSKFSNIEMIKAFSEWDQLEYAITYFYNVYGDNEISEGEYATVIGIFKSQYLSKSKITVVKPGSQLRNFTHIKDIVNALILIAENGKGDHYGIGSREKFSIIEIAQMFSSQIEFLPQREGNRLDSKLNIAKTLSLGWKPKESIIEHINQFKKENPLK